MNRCGGRESAIHLTDDLPKKLKPDAIVEAVFEARFETDPSLVPEVLFGRLADISEWRGFMQRRLPMADIPAAIRRADPNLRYQASLDLSPPDGSKFVRIGPQVLGYGRRAPYPGWNAAFCGEIARAIDALFTVIPKVSVTRLGLRYINALRSDAHGIRGVEQLNLGIVVGKVPLTHNLNLNYTVPASADSSCAVRVATLDFAQGTIPENTTVVADLDVYTNEPYQTSDPSKVMEWKEVAHIAEKVNFFSLLTADTIKRLRED